MATLAQSQPVQRIERETLRVSVWAAPVGRFFFSLIFILSGFRHFTSAMIGYAAQAGVPMPNVLVPLSGLMAVCGGLSVLSGYHARIGALLLIAFLVPVTLMMHNFWAVQDPMMAQMQMAMFMKNLSMLGGAIFIFCMGSGPYSLDHGKYKL